jgi:hydrogenase maturation protein HypF
MADNQLGAPALGIAWDGAGYGNDGTIWGGEFLLASRGTFQRLAHFRTFGLPGGERAIGEPRRSALGLLYEVFGEGLFENTQGAVQQAFAGRELKVLQRMLSQGVNTPRTSSVGRLFDAVASILGLCQVMSFEGQAAMALEFALPQEVPEESYDFKMNEQSSCKIIDWEPMVVAILEDVRSGVPAGVISARFHNALAEIAVWVASWASEQAVVLTGGCFQNRYLLERTASRLKAAGFQPYSHRAIPPNDGGIALGQVVAARWAQEKGSTRCA